MVVAGASAIEHVVYPPSNSLALGVSQVRVVLYIGLAVPGYFFAVTASYMPALIGSIYYTLAGVLSAISCFATQPTEKQWAWKWFGESTAKKNEQRDAGYKVDTFGNFLSSLPRILIIDTFERGEPFTYDPQPQN